MAGKIKTAGASWLGPETESVFEPYVSEDEYVTVTDPVQALFVLVPVSYGGRAITQGPNSTRDQASLDIECLDARSGCLRFPASGLRILW